MYTNLSPLTFPKRLKELSNKKFNMKKEPLDDKHVVALPWNHCLTDEYELGKEACKTASESQSGSAQRGGLRTDQANIGCSIGCSLSVLPTPASSVVSQKLAKLERDVVVTQEGIYFEHPDSPDAGVEMVLG